MSTNPGYGSPTHDGGDSHGAPSTYVDQRAREAGHEPDEPNVRGILIVPAMILVGFAVVFGTVTILISLFRAEVKPDPMAHPAVVARNKAPIDNRLASIELPESKGGAEQPRLEGLKRPEQEAGRDDPPYFRSSLPAATGNPPELHPEELLPTALRSDRSPRYPILNGETPVWIDQEKGVARIPLELALKLAPTLKGVLPTQKLDKAQEEAVRVQMNAIVQPGRPKYSNSGHGIPGTPGAFIQLAQPEQKNDEGKKEPPKKEGEKSKTEGKKE